MHLLIHLINNGIIELKMFTFLREEWRIYQQRNKEEVVIQLNLAMLGRSEA